MTTSVKSPSMAATPTTVRMRRSSTIRGAGADVDPAVKAHLTELNRLLAKPVLTAPVSEKAVNDLLGKKLTPKQKKDDTWDHASLAHALLKAPAAATVTLEDYINETTDLSVLRHAIPYHLEDRRSSLDPDVLAVLEEHPAIVNYLVILAYQQKDARARRRDASSLMDSVMNFILTHPAGVRTVLDYAVVGAARDLIRREHLSVPDATSDASAVVAELKKARLSISAYSFEKLAIALVERLISDGEELQVLRDVEKEIGDIPDALLPQIVRYMKASPIKIDNTNAKYFVPLFVSQIQETTVSDEPSDADAAASVKDFDVQYFEDDRSLVQISQSAVKCAAQLYYAMVVGDELNVFEVVNYFTHKYLVRGQVEIQDRRLRDDLQMYVFSGEYLDLDTKKVVDRTRPAERQMFYRQVFNYGGAQVTNDVIVNSEFSRLWKVLMLESARYLERAQVSPNPHSFVSKQNVMQAVEDLQYNLSSHCTGMATVISPLIYSELDFVIRRIFMHDEVRKHVVPAGGTWWRVVEALYAGMKNTRPKATVFYNKARLGHKIIRSIADYDPARFETDNSFSAFITDVDAFITTQSILQESLTDDLRAADDEEEADAGGQGGIGAPAEPEPAAAGGSQDEWDF